MKPRVDKWPLAILVLVLPSLEVSALGLAIGASTKPQQIGLLFSIGVVPITFWAASLIPEAYLIHLRRLQMAALIQPRRVHERGPARGHAGHPQKPALPIIFALLASLTISGSMGVRGFLSGEFHKTQPPP